MTYKIDCDIVANFAVKFDLRVIRFYRYYREILVILGSILYIRMALLKADTKYFPIVLSYNDCLTFTE